MRQKSLLRKRGKRFPWLNREDETYRGGTLKILSASGKKFIVEITDGWLLASVQTLGLGGIPGEREFKANIVINQTRKGLMTRTRAAVGVTFFERGKQIKNFATKANRNVAESPRGRLE